MLLDCGSGFGGAITHFHIQARPANSIGVEIVAQRHQRAWNMLREYWKLVEPPTALRTSLFLFEGNLADDNMQQLLSTCSHIYAFDARFHLETHLRLCEVLESCVHLKLFVSYKSKDFLRELLPSFEVIHQISPLSMSHTTETFTASFCRRKETIETTH